MKHIFFLFFLSVVFVLEVGFTSKENLKTKTLKINFFKKAYAVEPADETLPCAYQELLDQAQELLAEMRRTRWRHKDRCHWIKRPHRCFMAIFFDKKIRVANSRIPPIQEALEEARELAEGDDPSVVCVNPNDNPGSQNPPPTSPPGGPTGPNNQPPNDPDLVIPASFLKEDPKTGDITFFPNGPDKGGVTFKNGNLDDPKLWKKMGLNDQQIKDLKEWTEEDLLKGDLGEGSQNNESQNNKSQLLSQKNKNRKKLIDVPLKGASTAGSTAQTNNSSKNNQASTTKKSNSKSKKGFKSLFRKGFKGKNKKLVQSKQSTKAGKTKGSLGKNKATRLGLFLRIHQRYEKLNVQNYFF